MGTERAQKGIQRKSEQGNRRNLASTYKKLRPLLVTWFQISEGVEEQNGIPKEFQGRRLRKVMERNKKRVNLIDIQTEVTNGSN